ncbi:MAG: hypothetical protein KBF56_08650, partial [Gemmatimonadaceae bacterium]|nr:hypothetical protein [Gemmatimonadaceae bacterium]
MSIVEVTPLNVRVRAILRIAGVIEDRRDLTSTGHVGLTVSDAGRTNRGHHLGPLKRRAEERAQRRDVDVDRAG